MLRKKRIAVVIVMATLAAFLLTAAGPANPGSPTPNGFDKFLVYMAAGVYDPDEPNPLTPQVFQREIMGRSDEEIAQDRAAAIAFFNERFGLNLTDPGGLFTTFTQNGVEFSPLAFDPRNEYRAYVVSEERVPSSGWVVRDGGWRVGVVDPEGITLGGEFAGVHIPQNTSMVFGNYNIQRTLPGGREIEPIIIHYESGGPIIRNADLAGGLMFRCDLFSEEFGEGLAQGISAGVTLPDGRFQANIRNVLTFPGLGENAN
ncbi:MAG TPA: hypothetical protein VIK64_04300 [Anaerolineales bacterium]